MKKLVLVVALAIGFTSCKKEVDNETCNCGLIVSDNVNNYSVDIRNSCSNNVKTFYLTEGDWMNAHPGQDYCITNVTSW
jgi:hypothetical protein